MDDLPSGSCSGLNKTVYAYPYQEVAEVQLPNRAIAKLPVGVSVFQCDLDLIQWTFCVKVLGKLCRKFFDF